jgi:hypothetical protein
VELLVEQLAFGSPVEMLRLIVASFEATQAFQGVAVSVCEVLGSARRVAKELRRARNLQPPDSRLEVEPGLKDRDSKHPFSSGYQRSGCCT